jgi:hypothetical protein
MNTTTSELGRSTSMDPYGRLMLNGACASDELPSRGTAIIGLNNIIPAGTRLDEWTTETVTEEPVFAPEIEALREEFRTIMPDVANMLDVLASYRPIQDLTGRLAAPLPAKIVTQRID